MNTTIKYLLAALLAAGLGFGAGYYVSSSSQPASAGGGYFCCDSEPCVPTYDGDCKSAVQWCTKTGTDAAGVTVCLEW